MLGPLFVLLLVNDAIFGDLLTPSTPVQLVASTCWCFVGLTGVFFAFWPVWLGLRRRGLMPIAGSMLLLFPYWVLTTLAVWWWQLDFFRNPYNWLKTEHGLAKNRGAAPLAITSPVAHRN